MNIAVIGLGGIGRRHVANFLALGCEVRPWDTSLAALARATGEFHGQATSVATLEEALDGADGVVIATPPDSHEHLAVQALRLTKSGRLMIEKPLGCRPAEYDDWHFLQRVFVAYPWRHWPPLKYVKRLLDEERIGRVLSARTEYGYHLDRHGPHANRPDSYMRSLARGGGCLLDTSHAIDYLRWLLGEITEVSAVVENRALKMVVEEETYLRDLVADDCADLAVRFASGAVGALHLSLYLPEVTSRLEIVGETGHVRWDRRHGVFLNGQPTHTTTMVQPDINEMYAAEARHFLAVIRGEAQPVCNGWDGLRTLQIVDAARRSSAEKRWVTV